MCEDRVLAGHRSPPEFAEQGGFEWKAYSSELLWVAVKRRAEPTLSFLIS